MDSPADMPIVNALDIGVLVAMGLGGLIGLGLGFIRAGLFALSWIGAIFATFYGFPLARPYPRQWIETELFADLTAGVLVFVIVLVILFVISSLIGDWVRASRLSALDRSLGVFAGLATTALVIIGVYLVGASVWPQDDRPDWMREARSMKLIEPGGALLLALIPEGFFGTEEDEGKDGEEKKDADDKGSGTHRVVQELLVPKPKGAGDEKDGAPEGDAAGYGEKARQQMDRLNEILKDR